MSELAFKVGAKLFAQGDRWRFRDGVDVTVKKVGRKWAVIDDGDLRVDMETGAIEGTYPQAYVYASRDVYEAKHALREAWADLRLDWHRAPYSAPAGVTVERINEARRLLGMERKP